MKKTTKKKGLHANDLPKKEAALLNGEIHTHFHRKNPRMPEKDVRKKAAVIVETAGRARAHRERNGYHA